MHIFIGIDVDEYFVQLGKEVKKINRLLGFRDSTLPLHISLKYVFPIDDDKCSCVLEDVRSFFHNKKQFLIEANKIENVGNIVWLRLKNNDLIDNIHMELVTLLKDKYNIIPHAYDNDYIFHITLFMDDDKELIDKSYQMIKDFKIPNTFQAKKIAIGLSREGKVGTYYVTEELSLR